VGTPCAKLSGGQKQRMGIARELVKNTHILVQNEVTSSVDGNCDVYHTSSDVVSPRDADKKSLKRPAEDEVIEGVNPPCVNVGDTEKKLKVNDGKAVEVTTVQWPRKLRG